jgi:hypothetical protein
MKQLLLLCAIAWFPLSANAQEMSPQTASVSAAPVPAEAIEIASARRGLMFAGSSAGGLTLVARESTLRTSLFTQDRSRLTRTFRFLGADDAPIVGGACILRTQGRSLLGFQWNQRTTQLYACAVEDQPEAQFAFEVAVPAFQESSFSIGGFSMSAQDDVPEAEQQAVLRGRMVYRGVTYEAVPTGFDEQRGGGFSIMGAGQRRIVQGFIIMRDGAETGRVMFNMRDASGGTITAPVADAEGREAVLYMALQLHAMPDLFSPNVREEIAN